MADVGRPAPEVYRLSMEKLPLAVGRARRLDLLRVLGAATALDAILTAFTATAGEALDVALGVGALTVLALPYFMWRTARRVRRHWNAFELAVGGGTVRAAAKGAGRTIVRHEDITSITEGAGGLVVRAREPGVVIRVPRIVESYGDVRARLEALRPIVARPEALAWCAALVASGLVAGVAMAVPRVPGGVAIGLVLCQGAAALFVAAELGADPHLPFSTKGLGLVVALGAALLPIAGVFLR